MTIPASQLVQVNPSVLSAGGNALNITGLMLTQNTRVPIGSIVNYPTALAVSEELGASSVDAAAAAIYFAGNDGKTQTPGSLLVAQFPTAAVAAYLQSSSLSGVSIATLQSFNGALNVTIDGYPRSASINLSGANTFSQAAATIQSALNASLPVEATATASINNGTLTVTGTLTGLLAVGQTVTGSNTPAGTIVLAQLTGALNGTGTYSVTATGTIVVSQTLTFTATALSVTFDSVTNAIVIQSGITGNPSTAAYASGTLATDLLLTQALGAVLSQGTVAATPAAFMANIIRQNQNWATFFLNFNPDASGNSTKLAFAAWVATTNSRYIYLAGDNDVTPTLSTNAPTSLAQLVETANYSGVCAIYDPSFYPIAAFVAGTAASIDFNEPNGRITFAYKSQGGLVASVTDLVVADNLLANGYNFYGAYATATTQFVFFQNGSVSGPYLFLDSLVNAIWLTAQLQQALVELLAAINSIPYNSVGFGLIEAALGSTIQQGLTFGAFAAGVTLSSTQIAEVNSQAGANVAPTLQQRGWYLQVLDPGPAVRQVRGSPICTFWYVDGESVQLINLSDIKLN
jgi:hypothetical protein